MKQRYYIADVLNGVFEGPLMIVEAKVRLRFLISQRVVAEKTVGIDASAEQEIEARARRFYYVVVIEGKYTEVSIPGDRWFAPETDPVEWYLRLRAWFLLHDFNPLTDTEIAAYQLEPTLPGVCGAMYFEEPESGQNCTGRFSDDRCTCESKQYHFKPYQYQNETQSTAIRRVLPGQDQYVFP